MFNTMDFAETSAYKEDPIKDLNLLSDEDLYERYICLSENEALKILLIRHREELSFFIYGIVGNMDDAEEIMLDAYAQAAAKNSTFHKKSSFKTWLFAIGRNLALKAVRKRRFSFVSINEEISEDIGDRQLPENNILTSEKNRLLYEAVNKLPSDYRQAIYLTFFENMSNDEVAAVMKKSKKQVYNLIDRGKKDLKQKLLLTGYDFLDSV